MFNPKVSIIIPVYNGSNYLREAIDSALAQTYENLEILVINDGSNDDGVTKDIALSYGDKIRYFEKENGGVATALNLGIEKMEGEYFSWLSHDDVYDSEKINGQIKFMSDNNRLDCIIYSDYDLIDSTGQCFQHIRIGQIDIEKILYHLMIERKIHGCTLLIPRFAFIKYGMFPENLPTTQDYTLWLRFADFFKFIYFPRVVVKSRIHEMQGSRLLSHTDEVKEFYLRELYRLNPQYVKKAFDSHDMEYIAWEKIILHFKSLGLNECCQKVFNYASCSLKRKESIKLKKIISNSNKAHQIMLNLRSQFIRSKTRKKEGSLKLDFDNIYANNGFAGRESKSGEGSSLEQTKIVRTTLPKLFQELGISKLLDVPCGDWNWMRHIDLSNIDYIGGDVVTAIIDDNNRNYAGKSVQFVPTADLILCRDCLVHMSFKDALKSIEEFKKSGSKWLLTTTFVSCKLNDDLIHGSIWRPLNLEKLPFNFPPAVKYLNEGCSEEGGLYQDKSLGLWLIEDLIK